MSGLDYRDPMFDPHVAFQHLKRHPLVASVLEGGQLVRYGAKALPEGGWYTIPKTYAAGALIVGDAGGFMNSVRLKGIHLAMRTGMAPANALRTAQYAQFAFSLVLTWFLLRLCRQIDRDSAWLPVFALACLGIIPTYYKTFAMIRGEPLLATCAVVAAWLAIRTFATSRRRCSQRSG